MHCEDLGSLSRSLFLDLLFEPDSYSNEYLLATFGFDTAENEPCKVCPIPRGAAALRSRKVPAAEAGAAQLAAARARTAPEASALGPLLANFSVLKCFQIPRDTLSARKQGRKS